MSGGVAVKDRVASLSPEKRRYCEQMVIDNQRLAAWGVGKYSGYLHWMEHDDIYSLFLEALWRSAMTWDPGIAKFSTYAVNNFRAFASREKNRHYCKKRAGDDQPLSFDYAYEGGDDYYDLLVDLDDAYGQYEVETLVSQVLHGRSRRIVERKLEGETLEEIGQRECITRERVRQILIEARHKIYTEIAA